MPDVTFRTPRPVRTGLLAVAIIAAGALSSSTYAQTGEPRGGAGAVQSAPPVPVADPRIDAQETRRELIEVLRKHPPSVGRVIKLDPSLMRNDSYLSAYPALRTFLARHPEIPQNAPYYLESIYVGDHNWEPPNERVRLVEGTLAGLGGFTAFVIVLSTLVWLIKTVLEQRRWSRLSKIQAEVHSKLMDRFSSNEELLTYVQTPSGRRFLESGPSPLQEGPKAISAPFSRILWSVQIGVVLVVGGLGLLYVSGNTFEEVREFFFITGSLAIALGAGFSVSAAASYLLSRRLGLFDRPTTDNA
jgi:hypothetical protein